MIYSPQGEGTRHKNVGLPRSAGFLWREEHSGADAEAAAERLSGVAVDSLHRAGGEAASTPPVDRKIKHIWTASASPILPLLLPPRMVFIGVQIILRHHYSDGMKADLCVRAVSTVCLPDVHG